MPKDHRPSAKVLPRKASARSAALVAARPASNAEDPTGASAEPDALLKVAAALNRGNRLDEQLERAVSALPSILGARRVVLVLTDADVLGAETAGPLVIESTVAASRRLPPEAADAASLMDEKDGAVTAAPIKAGGRVIGTLTVAGSDMPLEGARFRLLGGVLDAVGVRCEGAQIAHSLAEQSADGDVLQSAVRIAAEAGDTAGKLRRLGGLVLRVMDGGLVGTGRKEQGESGIHWLSATSAGGERNDLLGRVETVGTLVTSAMEDGVPAVVNDFVEPGPRLLGSFSSEGRAAAVFPLRANGESPGVMLVVSRASNSFSRRRMRVLSGIAGVVGMLVRSEELREGLEAGQRREQQRLEAFHTAATRLTIEEEPEGALRQFVDSARRLVGAKYGGVVVWDREGQVRTLVSLGLPTGDAKPDMKSLRVNELLALVRYALVLEQKKAIRVAGSSLIPNKADPEVPLLRSLLGVPFMGKDGSPGAFFLVDKIAQPRFSPDDERLLNLFSSMAAMLLDNINLYDELERQHRTLSGIQNSMDEGLVVLDHQGRVILSNPAADRLSGTSLAQLQGMRLSHALREGEACFESPEPVHALVACLESPLTAPAGFEMTLVRPKRCDVAVSVFPIEVSPTERLTGLLLRDVTDERDLQRRRDTFVSVASHELRTPMTTIMGFTELLLKRDVPASQRMAWLQHMHEDGQRVIRIVDDLLNVSRIQSGNLNVLSVEADAAELAREAVAALESSSDIHQITMDIPPSLPPVIADPDKVVQVLLNLLSNAIKYSPQGGPIVVSARHDPDNGRVVMAVKDTGIGIAEEHLDRLFTTFQRIDREETRAIRGTGLGLYIVKSLIELMGGAVGVESKLDVGSTFHCSLPTAPR